MFQKKTDAFWRLSFLERVTKLVCIFCFAKNKGSASVRTGCRHSTGMSDLIFRASMLQKKTDAFWRLSFFGAGDEARTRYLHLGKVALYQMSYTRIEHWYYSTNFRFVNTFFMVLGSFFNLPHPAPRRRQDRPNNPTRSLPFLRLSLYGMYRHCGTGAGQRGSRSHPDR